MSRFVFVFLSLSQLVLAACPREPMPPEPDYVVFPPYDAGIDAEVEVLADCRVACENLAKLGCPESAPAGRTCGSVCSTSTRLGFDLRLPCVASAGTPDHVRACCTPGQPCSQVRCRGR
jgi:hypothetical protein